MGEADTLRRAMGKKDRDLMATQKAKFVGGCAERAIAAAKAERVWELMEKFAGYGFNKSHAAAYALVAYQTAYFKANYPVEFMAALLTSEMGDTDKIVKYIDECRAMEIPVQPPDVNTSAVRFSVAGRGHPLRPGRHQERGRGGHGVDPPDARPPRARSGRWRTSAVASTFAWSTGA